MKLLKIVIFLLFFAAFPCLAAEVPAWQNDKISIEVYTSAQTITPEQEFQILIKIRMLNGWHTAWDNPGDAGIPTTFSWQTPQGWHVSRVNETAPEKMIYDDIIVQYGYQDTAYYLFTVSPDTNSASDGQILLKIDWAACREYCKPEYAEFSISLPSIGKEHIPSPQWAQNYQNADQSFPEIMAAEALYRRDGDVLSFYFSDQKFSDTDEPAYIILQQPHVISPAAEQNKDFIKNNILKVSTEAEDELSTPIGGILFYGSQAYKFALKPSAETQPLNIFYLLLTAFIGGLILNFMPCVFPVLSLKAISLVSHQTQTSRFKNGIRYTLGVLLSFLLIAALLYLLRRQGEQIGWGFQLQSPLFVAVMLLIFIFILLLMLDMIKIKGNFLSTLTQISAKSSFLTGFFAVLIASPCTGPFMGAALGYTLMQPPYVYFPIFISLGLGYALPFALVEIFPKAIKKILPAPGKWMNVLKKILAIPVLLTCLWLGWVLFNQLRPQNTADNLWQPYQPDKIEQLIQEGKPVFIDFTAKWCLTCLMNEKTTLQGERFEQFIKRQQITLFKADWTNRDEKLMQALQTYGRSSVPLYIYHPGEGSHIILPQILTPSLLEDYLMPTNTQPENNRRKQD